MNTPVFLLPLLLVALGLVFVAIAAWRAPRGYEDQAGFHTGPEQDAGLRRAGGRG